MLRLFSNWPSKARHEDGDVAEVLAQASNHLRYYILTTTVIRRSRPKYQTYVSVPQTSNEYITIRP